MEKERINKNNGKKNISAPKDQGGAQTTSGYDSQSPKRTDKPSIYGDLFGKNGGYHAPKIYE